MTGRSWGKPEMDKLEQDIRSLLADSNVPAEDQSSVLHMLASGVDQMATGQAEDRPNLIGTCPECGQFLGHGHQCLPTIDDVRGILRDDRTQ